MTELQFTPQQQLANALKQLQSATVRDASANNGIAVLVKAVSVQHILMISGNREIRAGIRSLEGHLLANTPYQVLPEPGNPQRLQFFSYEQPSSAAPQVVRYPLPPPLAQAIRTQALIAGLQSQSNPVSIPAEVLSQQAGKLTLQLPAGPLTLALAADSGSFSVGQKLNLELLGNGNHWQLRISQSPAQAVPAATSARLPLYLSLSRPLLEMISVLSSRDPAPVSLTPAQLTQIASRQGLSMPPPLQQWLQTTTALPAQAASTELALGLVKGNILEVSLPGQASLQAVATLQKADVSQVSATLWPSTRAPSGESRPVSSPAYAPVADKAVHSAAPSPTLQAGTPDQVTRPPLLAQAQVGAPGADFASPTQAPPMQTTTSTDSYQRLVALSRQLQVLQDNPQQVLTRLAQSVAANRSPELSVLLQPLWQKVSAAVVRGDDIHTDAENLRQLFSAPALPVTALSLNNPPANQGMLGGLMLMLQVALASRLARHQPSLTDKLAERLGTLIDSARGNAGQMPISGKLLGEFSQLEQRQQLLRQLGQLLSAHSAAKATSADLQWQKQDVFHYSLPLFGPQRDPLEILIRREPPPEDKRQGQTRQDKQWQLSMRLEIGELGALLAKARLFRETLELDFYAANQPLLAQVTRYLPMLTDRLKALGLSVQRSQCQLGKIPDQLQTRPYHLFETKA